MAYPAADQRRVYLACRPIFTGNNALLRKSKKVRELVSVHQTSLQPLVQDFTIEKVVNIIKNLLERELFQSDVKAKIEFPELFQSSPARDAQRAASENDAARSAAEALEEVASQENGINSDDERPNDIVNINQDITNSKTISIPVLLKQTIDQPQGSAAAEQPSQIFSLYPMYFPYHAQHVILSKVQSVLEESCFDFVQKWKPSILADGGWDCPAAVELTVWTKLLVKNAGKLPQDAFNESKGSLSEILFATHKLRHTAVHRLPTTSRGVEELVKSAVSFAEALQDTLRATQLENLRSEIDSQIIAMELSKNALEDNLSQELKRIQRQREELDMREKEHTAKMISEDRNNNCLVGDLLEDSVSKLFDVKPAEESADDVDQLFNANGKHQEDAIPISDSVAVKYLSITEAPTNKSSSEISGFNPFRPSTIKQPVFDFSRMGLNEITKMSLDRGCGWFEASTIGNPDEVCGFNPFMPSTFKQPVFDISRMGISEITKASLDPRYVQVEPQQSLPML